MFSVPLWNFGIPYKLKHLIDAISHKGVLFTFDEQGLNGMLGGRRAVAIYSRGLGYGSDSQTPDQAFGTEKPFIDTWFRFVGINQCTVSWSNRRLARWGPASVQAPSKQ